ncbi:hypothetical protein [Paenibacillus sp. NAIST15-1]|nr:hypothetical protein [Paenibacillus sp. NAIST15-1]GAV13225.1 hypothetical protein PBN151_3159 [Paenibacillus sp. NAIST15-1]
MKSLYYDFLVDCWRKGLADENKLETFVPIFISDEERQQIIATPTVGATA